MSNEDLGTVLYETTGPIATITMNRPEARNAQNTALIDDLDRAFGLAEADDDVRVVVLAGVGDHFSAGHDLKSLLSDTAGDRWAGARATAEGKLRHEQVMYYDKCMRIHDFRKPTIAQVQGACVAAGLMLASMCDIIVAADDAFFSNPVARMSGVGVELLIEPWELGVRKAKEFMLTGEKLDAQEAWRLGLVNRVVPRAELEKATIELAEKVALVPPITAEMIKDSLNRTQEAQGKQQSWRYHFMVHQFVSNSDTALRMLESRKQKSMKEVFESRDRGEG
jgi:enoyl-CoA hydratase